MSYTTIQAFWRDLARLDLSRGPLAKVVKKSSAAIRHPWEELRDVSANQDRLGIDESGHTSGESCHWIRFRFLAPPSFLSPPSDATVVRNDFDVWAYVKDLLDRLLAGDRDCPATCPDH